MSYLLISSLYSSSTSSNSESHRYIYQFEYDSGGETQLATVRDRNRVRDRANVTGLSDPTRQVITMKIKRYHTYFVLSFFFFLYLQKTSYEVINKSYRQTVCDIAFQIVLPSES